MSKDFKRCPRCNTKIARDFGRCGNCGLNFVKFETATAKEAKSAFRMGEKERILYTKSVPQDVNKVSFFISCLLGGWFGLHYFQLGKIWRGLYQLLGLILLVVYSLWGVSESVRSAWYGSILLIGGIIGASAFIIWLIDSISIIFNRFKYPVSLPYSTQKPEKGE